MILVTTSLPSELRFAQRELFAQQAQPAPMSNPAGPAGPVVKKGPREERYERRRQVWIMWCEGRGGDLRS